MENTDLQAVADAVVKRLFVPLEASGRHVHVTKEQAQCLFGHELTPKRPLSQPGQYLANERVTVIGPKGRFENVAVLGPERKEAQVEISLTDGRALGVQPPVRLSGDVKNSPGTVLEGPRGRVEIRQGVIAAKRHIHMTPGGCGADGSPGQAGCIFTGIYRPSPDLSGCDGACFPGFCHLCPSGL